MNKAVNKTNGMQEEIRIGNTLTSDQVLKAFFKGLMYGLFVFLVACVYVLGVPTPNGTGDSTEYRPIVIFISTVIISPFFEEWVCRYLVYKKLGDFIHKLFSQVVEKGRLDYFFLKYGDIVTMILSSLVFISIHRTGLMYWPLYFFISVAFCSSYTSSQSMITPIVAHSIYNLISFSINLTFLRMQGG